MQTKTIFAALALALSGTTFAAPIPQNIISGNGNNNGNGNLNNNTIASNNSIGDGLLANNNVSILSCSGQQPQQSGLINLAKRLYILLEVNLKGTSASVTATTLPSNSTGSGSSSSSPAQGGLINVGPLC